MEIHHYHPKTGEYRAISEARTDPITKRPLIPAHATTTQPPPGKEGYARCFLNQKWEQIEDHRGAVVFDHRTPKTIKAIGPIPSRLKSHKTPKTREEKLSAIREKRNQMLSATDWMMLSDAPLTAKEIDEAKAYRQALRDLPASINNPDEIQWPKLAIKKDFRS